MLGSAAELFHSQGYHATGLNQLVSAGGAPKGSLYFHFSGGLGAIVDALGQVWVESDFTRGCPIATVALDAATVSEPIRSACQLCVLVRRDHDIPHDTRVGRRPRRAARHRRIRLARGRLASRQDATRYDAAPRGRRRFVQLTAVRTSHEETALEQVRSIRPSRLHHSATITPWR